MQVIDAAMARCRTVILGLVSVLIAGIITYVTIPKEAEPDIEIPIIYVYIEHVGISPEDAERLLVRPMEQEIRSIEGIKEMIAEAFERQCADRVRGRDRYRQGPAGCSREGRHGRGQVARRVRGTDGQRSQDDSL
jgi:hypothetical protein